MSADVDAYHELCAYTLSLGDAEFIHQHVVDAFAAQDATPSTRPPEGIERAKAIDAWCASVWNAYGANRDAIDDLLQRNEIIAPSHPISPNRPV